MTLAAGTFHMAGNGGLAASLGGGNGAASGGTTNTTGGAANGGQPSGTPGIPGDNGGHGTVQFAWT